MKRELFFVVSRISEDLSTRGSALSEGDSLRRGRGGDEAREGRRRQDQRAREKKQKTFSFHFLFNRDGQKRPQKCENSYAKSRPDNSSDGRAWDCKELVKIDAKRRLFVPTKE